MLIRVRVVKEDRTYKEVLINPQYIVLVEDVVEPAEIAEIGHVQGVIQMANGFTYRTVETTREIFGMVNK